MVGQSLCITRKTLTTLSLYCAFRNLDSFWTLYIEGTCLSITNCKCTESVAPRQFSAHLFEQHHVQNEQLDSPDCGLVSSVVFIQPLFVSVSPSLLLHHSHTSSSLSFPHLIFFQWIHFHSKTLQGCIHFAPVIWQILSFSIVGLVLRPSLVG